MVHHLLREVGRRQLRARGQQVAPEVALHEATEQVDGAVDREQPREEEVPAPARGEILVRRDREPGREAAWRERAVLARRAQQPGRLDRERAQPHDAAPLARAAQRVHRQPRGVVVGAVLAPVQARMGVEDLRAGHQQQREAEDVDPVRHPHERGVARHKHAPARAGAAAKRARGHCGGGHGGKGVAHGRWSCGMAKPYTTSGAWGYRPCTCPNTRARP